MTALRNLTRRLGRLVAVSGTSLAVMATVATTSAQAAVTEIWAGVDASVVNDHRTSPVTSTVNFHYSTFVTADNAQFRIDYGAKATFLCYGLDYYSKRVYLFSTSHTKYTTTPLVAYGDGMLVNATFSRPKGTLFNVNKSGQDRLFCDVSYTDPFTKVNVFTTSGTVMGSY